MIKLFVNILQLRAAQRSKGVSATVSAPTVSDRARRLDDSLQRSLPTANPFDEVVHDGIRLVGGSRILAFPKQKSIQMNLFSLIKHRENVA